MKIYYCLLIRGRGLFDVGELSSSYVRYSSILSEYIPPYLLRFIIDVDVYVLLSDDDFISLCLISYSCSIESGEMNYCC